MIFVETQHSQQFRQNDISFDIVKLLKTWCVKKWPAAYLSSEDNW